MDAFQGVFTVEAFQTGINVLVKAGIGVLLAGLIGWERELHGRPAGIRTHMMLVLGVILFSEGSKAFPSNDPSRIAAQIVTGVGFLGAGTILRMGAEIKGLTTAASLWASAGIGMMVSVGGPYLWVAVIGTIFALITLGLVDNLERKFNLTGQSEDLFVRISSRECLSAITAAIESAGGKVNHVSFGSDADQQELVFKCNGNKDTILSEVIKNPDVKTATWIR